MFPFDDVIMQQNYYACMEVADNQLDKKQQHGGNI